MNNIINKIYEVFSIYKLPDKIGGCEHCISDDESKIFYKKKLRELSNDDLNNYYFSGVLTWGTVNELKYFLPRIIELIENDYNTLNVDIEQIFSKLHYSKWLNWNINELNVLRSYFHKKFIYEISSYINPDDRIIDIDDWLCTIGLIENQYEIYLNEWENIENENAYKNLIEYINDNTYYFLKKKRLKNAYWDGCEYDNDKKTIEWIISDKVYNKLLNQIDKYNFIIEGIDNIKKIKELAQQAGGANS